MPKTKRTKKAPAPPPPPTQDELFTLLDSRRLLKMKLRDLPFTPPRKLPKREDQADLKPGDRVQVLVRYNERAPATRMGAYGVGWLIIARRVGEIHRSDGNWDEYFGLPEIPKIFAGRSRVRFAGFNAVRVKRRGVRHGQIVRADHKNQNMLQGLSRLFATHGFTTKTPTRSKDPTRSGTQVSSGWF